MINRINQWLDWVHATPIATTQNSTKINVTTSTNKEGPVPTTTAVRNTGKRIEHLRAELDAIADEATTDPIEAALLLAEWEAREADRNRRRLQLMAELRRREELGGLADDPAVLAAISSFVSRTAETRAALAPVIRTRAWPATGSVKNTNGRLEKWWAAIIDLDHALPVDNEDAHRYIQTQVAEWFSARSAVMIARAVVDGVEPLQPELNPLPRNLVYGLHRP